MNMSISKPVAVSKHPAVLPVDNEHNQPAVPANQTVPAPTNLKSESYSVRTNTEGYWTVKEAAHYLNITTGTLYHWKRAALGMKDPIPFVKFSARCLRFP